MFNPNVFANSRPDGISAMEIISAAEHQTSQPRLFVPLKRSELSGEVAGPLASLRLTQIYGYTKEQCDRTLEAVYRFPLPGDAAVTAVRVLFGDVEIHAELKRRKQAETDYEEARLEGRQAALATRESPDVFTLRVAGIQPDQEIEVETCYAQLARAEGSGWSLRIPLTTAPRYARGDEIASRHAEGQPLALLRDPGHRFSLDLIVRGAALVESGTHQLTASEEDGGVRVRLRDGEVVPDRDCVLMWRAKQEARRPALQVFVQDDPDSGQAYFLALVSPPSDSEAMRRAPREAILLVDHSGSMEGAKWAAADWAVKSFLYGLSERDTMALGLFHSSTKWFDKKTRQADGATVEEAIRFLEANRDSGGTELGVALEQALGLARATQSEGGERARHALIITDAEVSNAGRILRLADEESRREDRRRISVLCIDAAPNSHLALELAERGGGVAKFLTSDPDEEDISTALDEALADWSEPVLTGLRLEVNSPVAQAAGREIRASREQGWTSIDLGDLPAGRVVCALGRAPRSLLADFSFKLTRQGIDPELDCQVELHRIDEDRSAIKALFGARRVLGLEYLIDSGYAGDELRDQLARLGYDPGRALITKSQVYAENARVEAEEALRNLLAREALDYGLACSETAFVAVRKEAGQVIEGSVAVANAVPAGWSDRFERPAVMACRGPIFRERLIEPNFSLRSDDQTEDLASMPTVDMFMADTVAGAQAWDEAELPVPDRIALFSGRPQGSGEIILFDSAQDQASRQLSGRGKINRLIVSFPDGAPAADNLGAGLCLLLFVDDLATPRARVKLADLVRQGGARPLNLIWKSGQALRLALVDPASVWSAGAPHIEVALEWEEAALGWEV
ncbi:MAG: VIT domain-containing protein [Blastocatellales bacterium]